MSIKELEAKKIIKREEVIQPFSTTNYEIFKKFKGNRDVSRVKILMECIENHGFVKEWFIIVNSKMEVLDGQHRLEACKELGIPVYFVINDKIDLTTIQEANASTSKWKTIQFINSYAESGKEDYVKLSKFVDKYKKIGLHTVIAVSEGSIHSGGMTSKKISTGNYKFVETEEKVDFILNELNKYQDILKNKNLEGRPDCKNAGVIFALKSDEVDNDRLYDILEKYCSEIKGYNTEMFLKDLSVCYNRGGRFKKGYNRIALDADYRKMGYK